MTTFPPLSLCVPGSKSQTQRALLLAALTRGESFLHAPLDCGDSRYLRQALRVLGAEITEGPEGWRVRGGMLRRPLTPLDCGEGGTTVRFLAPLALLLDGPLILDGSPRLRERPLSDLVQALEGLGVTACSPAGASLPLELQRTRPTGGWATVDASRSSQFASGLLLVGPLLPDGLHLELHGPPVSRPYLELTLQAMRVFGVEAQQSGWCFTVPPLAYRPASFFIEGDWSSAAFLLAAGWILGRQVRVENLRSDSAQGDRAILGFLEELSRPRLHSLDLADCPDLVAPLAAAAAFADQPVELASVGHARLKESDRLAVLAEGLERAGVELEQHADALLIRPGGRLRPARLDPHGDHRMAMAFALLGLRQPGIVVVDPDCVDKSYPSFWQDLERLR